MISSVQAHIAFGRKEDTGRKEEDMTEYYEMTAFHSALFRLRSENSVKEPKSRRKPLPPGWVFHGMRS